MLIIKNPVSFIGDWCDFDYPETVALMVGKYQQKIIDKAQVFLRDPTLESVKITIELSRSSFWDEQWVIVYESVWFWHGTKNGVEFVEG